MLRSISTCAVIARFGDTIIDLAENTGGAPPKTFVSAADFGDYFLNEAGTPFPQNGPDAKDGKVTITGQNHAPVANNDFYFITEREDIGDPALTVNAPGVLANDTDEDGDALTATKLTDPLHGSVVFNSNGSFVYTPVTGYLGPDSFTYRADDTEPLSSVATVNITVTPRLSIPTNLAGALGGTVVVPVFLDNPNPLGNGGITGMQLVLTYQTNRFSVSATTGPGGDFQLGTANSGANTVQQITFGGSVTGGTFTLAFNNGTSTVTTSPIPYSTSASTLQSNIQSALNGLSNIGSANPLVNATSATNVSVTFQGTGAQGQKKLSTMAANGALLTGASPTVGVVSTTIGYSPWGTPTINLNTTTGQIAIVSSGSESNDNQTGGSLILITFHVLPTAPLGPTPINLAASVAPSGATVVTRLDTSAGTPLTLRPPITNDDDDPGVDGIVTISSTVTAATHFSVTGTPGTATAGTSFSFTVTALDSSEATVPSYNGTVSLTSDDPNVSFSPNNLVTLTNGVGTFQATLKTVGSRTITATDTVTASINGTSAAINVVAGATTRFNVSASPTTITAGQSTNITVTSFDAFNNPTIAYNGSVVFGSTDPQAGFPAGPNSLTNGSGTFSVQLKSAGVRTVTVSDSVTGTINGTSNAITVNPGVTSKFSIVAPPNATSGVTFQAIVTALDAFDNPTNAAYTGTVVMGSSDGQAQFTPNNVTLVNGSRTYDVILKAAGSQSITATDSINTGITGSTSVNVVADTAATSFTVSAAPSSITAGGTVTFTVTARDSSGNVATSYTGTVTFTSNDPASTNTNGGLPADYIFQASDNGIHTFTAVLKTVGSRNIIATDVPDVSITGTSNAITVTPGATTRFTVVTASTTVTAGTQVDYTVTSLDAFDNVTTNYTGTVSFTTNDGAATPPANTTLTSGTKLVSMILKSAGSRTLTAFDLNTPSINGTNNAVTVTAGALASFAVNGSPASITAGGTVGFTVTAVDQFSNTINNYSGTVHIDSTDPNAVEDADKTLTGGTGLFNVLFKTSGTQSVTANDTVQTTIRGTSNAITVSPGLVTRFAVAGTPTTVTAGNSANFNVQALDQFDNLVTGYAGTVSFTVNDPAVPPLTNSTLTNGVGNFPVTLKTAGARRLIATDTADTNVNGTSNDVTVVAAALSKFSVALTPTSVTAGALINMTVTALDTFNNTVVGYTGTVHFAKSDSGDGSLIPADYTFVTGDSGIHTFTGEVKFVTTGSQTVTAQDTATPAIVNTSNAVTVTAAAATTFSFNTPGSATAGVPFTFTVFARDQFANIATGYLGTISFSSNDTTVSEGNGLPVDYTFTVSDAGLHTFQATLNQIGNRTITATDNATPAITGTSSAINIAATGVATAFTVTGTPATATAGTSFTFTVTAVDGLGSPVPGYSGVVNLTTTDSAGTFTPASPVTITGGTGTFSATLRTVGTWTITATDAVTPSINGTSNNINVVAGAATRFTITGTPATVTAGNSANFNVQALDAFDNVATGYTGTVSFTIDDPQATAPGNTTLTNGVGNFSIQLKSAGNRRLSAVDTSNALIVGTSNAVNVIAAAASKFNVALSPTTAIAGNTVTLTVTALDPFNNTATTYVGTVQFTEDDPGAGAIVPGAYTFVPGDNGTRTFTNGVTFVTVGNRTVTATDTATNIVGTSNNVTVIADDANSFVLTTPPGATTGVPFNFTLTVRDQFNNIATGYTGTVGFTSSDPAVSPGSGLPNNYTFTSGDAGVHTFSATLVTLGNQTIRASIPLTTRSTLPAITSLSAEQAPLLNSTSALPRA